MPWVETPSLSFTARHEASQADDALAVLEDLEQHRGRLEELLPRVPGGVTVVLHDSPIQLLFASPMLAVMRRVASRAARSSRDRCPGLEGGGSSGLFVPIASAV